VDAQDARSYRLGRGFGGGPYASFPSGHTTTAFAAAAAVTAETWEWWPRARWIIAPTMYGGATAVGLSRMYNNKHWASDVAMGALLGTFAGIKTVRYHHTRPGNRLDKIMLGARVVPSLDGNALTVSLSPRLIEFPARPK
jgi:membrane-associated phospholipid phosphatase